MRCKSVKVWILTVSDRAFSGERADGSGPALARELEGRGWVSAGIRLVPDERKAIEDDLRRLADEDGADIILTTGGTGVAPRDVTPEATAAVISRRVPGLAEAMRTASLKVTANAMLSRAEAGIRGSCLIINLPGSPKGAVECFEVVAPALEHAHQLLRGESPDG